MAPIKTEKLVNYIKLNKLSIAKIECIDEPHQVVFNLNKMLSFNSAYFELMEQTISYIFRLHNLVKSKCIVSDVIDNSKIIVQFPNKEYQEQFLVALKFANKNSNLFTF